MYFAIIARDNTEPGTLEKRLANRDAHLEKIHAMKAEGSIIDGGAMLNDDGDMVGSIVLCHFPDRAALDAYLAEEIYATQRVWGDIEIVPFRRVSWKS
ncbi:YciI family protein [Pelagibacterium sp. H642]|uniref:YciI family protein n=1 Tax=Pelagibacterium sp. H642 TaxID=1881069 RepID=UPI00281654FE|nr:YciI family protein [Pelagibacterium sp. H642]WMT91899.1 YciI family protein [Pelagibacterium sp. H642]